MSWLSDLLNSLLNRPGPPPVPTPTPVPVPTPLPVPVPTPTPVPDSIISQLLALHNQARARAGLPALILDDRLNAASRGHADWMAATSTMSHTGSGHSNVGQRVTAAGYRWSYVGENIAEGYKNAVAVMNGWMNSPGHMANILSPNYRMVGFALAHASGGATYWVADFAKPLGAMVKEGALGQKELKLHLSGPLSSVASGLG